MASLFSAGPEHCQYALLACYEWVAWSFFAQVPDFKQFDISATSNWESHKSAETLDNRSFVHGQGGVRAQFFTPRRIDQGLFARFQVSGKQLCAANRAGFLRQCFSPVNLCSDRRRGLCKAVMRRLPAVGLFELTMVRNRIVDSCK